MSKTYTELNILLCGRNRERKKLANNTYAERRPDNVIAVRLHATDVLTFTPDGAVKLDSGGWKTSTTKDRFNSFLPDGWRVSQHRGQWTVSRYTGNGDSPRFDYADGMVIRANGKVTGAASASDLKEQKTLRKRILAFAKLCGESIPLPMPGAGDCFYCGMREVKTDKPLGECNADTSHLLSHFDEKYVVPSLVWRAIEQAGCNPNGSGCAWFWYAFKLPGAPSTVGAPSDWQRKQVGSFVAKYLKRQFKLV